MQFLIKIQIYIKKNTIHGEICMTPHINPQPISALGHTVLGLLLESRVDFRCHTDFAVCYSLFILFFFQTPCRWGDVDFLNYLCLYLKQQNRHSFLR